MCSLADDTMSGSDWMGSGGQEHVSLELCVAEGRREW